MNWQPIETAPRDGMEILAYREYSGITIASWADWISYSDLDPKSRWENRDGFEIHPTHWMPLPKPPELSSNH